MENGEGRFSSLPVLFLYYLGVNDGSPVDGSPGDSLTLMPCTFVQMLAAHPVLLRGRSPAPLPAAPGNINPLQGYPLANLRILVKGFVNKSMFDRGEHVILRDIYQGRVAYVRPATVVYDKADEVALYFAVGTPMKWVYDLDLLAQGTWECRDRIQSKRNILMLLRPDTWHSIWLMWDHSTWEFLQWYVNFQLPFKRTALGFDTADKTLDITVDIDRKWQWKDEGEFAYAQEIGLIQKDEAAVIRAEGERVIGWIEARDYPFTEDWIEWRPDKEWTIPDIPLGWDRVIHGQ